MYKLSPSGWKELRTDEKLTQKGMGEKLGISGIQVRKLEAGDTLGSIKIALKAMFVFGIDFELSLSNISEFNPKVIKGLKDKEGS